MQPPRQIFRSVSIERLSTPEQLDQLMQVTDTRGWLALIGIASLLVAALIWGFFGNIPDIVTGQGLLMRGNRIQQVQAPGNGQVTDVAVNVGDEVVVGQVVARIRAPSESTTVNARSKEAGRVTEVGVGAGDFVQTGNPLVSLEREDLPLRAVFYIPATSGKKIVPNMDVQIEPATVRKEDYGQLVGHVTYVSPFPVTSQAMQNVLGNADLVKQFTKDGPPIEVQVELVPDVKMASGYRWTSQQGPPTAIVSGTPATATITVAQQRPINLIFAKITGNG